MSYICLISYLFLFTSLAFAQSTQSITLQEILRGASRSIEAQKVQLRAVSNERNKLRAKYDGKISSSISPNFSKADSAPSPVQVEKMSQLQTKVQYQQLLRSGTLFSAEWQFGHQDSQFVSLPARQQYQTQAALAIKQSLWRNAFGRNLQTEILVIQEQEEANTEQAKAQLQTLAMLVVKQYYQAWLLQARLAATLQNIKLQKRLHHVSKLKFELGTSEKTDILQIKASLLGLQQRAVDTESGLRNIWAQMIVSVNLPVVYIGTDIAKMHLVLDDDYAPALVSCATLQKKNRTQLQSPRLQSLKHGLKAIEHRFTKQKDALLPDLYLSARLANNGVSSDFGNSITSSLTEFNINASLSLSIDIELGKYRLRAEIADTLQQKRLAELDIQQASSELQVEAITTCADLARLIRKEKIQRSILTQQRQRIGLQEEHFRLGQVDVLQVVQASNDLIEAEYLLKETIQGLALSIWQIRKIDGSLFNYMHETTK